MLLNTFKFYLLGLVIAFFVCLVIGAIWLGWRALRRADKTVKERQGALYDAIMMSMVSIPVLAFAFMAILIVLCWHIRCKIFLQENHVRSYSCTIQLLLELVLRG